MSTTQHEVQWPERGTPESVLWSAAMDVALAAPARQNPTSSSAHVPWSTIHALRAAIEGVGIDWDAFKKHHDDERSKRQGEVR
jgi:hypothetical protein